MKTINNELKNIFNEFNPIVYKIELSSNALNKSNSVKELIDKTILEVNNVLKYEDICKEEILNETRNAYKALKKDPSHTKPACESLIRRIIKNKELYIIGDAVDLGNVLSIKTERSVCVADYDLIKGDITITKGTKEESFEGIRRDLINAENLIVYKDDIGIFGSTTSDTMRTCINENTKTLLVMCMCFSSLNRIENEQLLIELFTHYLNVKAITKLN